MDEQPTPSTTPGSAAGDDSPARHWQPLTSRQRRVLGVLAEKAKTTPEHYPLSLNALVSGCNQKSNRSPQMNLTADEVEQVIDELRAMEAVVEVQGSGRVPKYKHCLYQWLGVDKVELAIMAELLLRGEQTLGELRGRASRMERIADLNTLRPLIQSLTEKELVVELTPEGRGQLVTHGLYPESELEKVRARVDAGAYGAPRPSTPAPSGAPAASASSSGVSTEEFEQLKEQVAQLRSRVDELGSQIQTLLSERQ